MKESKCTYMTEVSFKEGRNKKYVCYGPNYFENGESFSSDIIREHGSSATIEGSINQGYSKELHLIDRAIDSLLGKGYSPDYMEVILNRLVKVALGHGDSVLKEREMWMNSVITCEDFVERIKQNGLMNKE